MMDGRALRDEGMTRAMDAEPEWADLARHTVAVLAASHHQFTAEDVVKAIGPHPRSSVALGGVFAGASRQKLIRKTGRYLQSGRASSHARPLCEWIGR